MSHPASRPAREPDVELVRRTAALARLSIDDAEARELGREFASILEHFRALQSLDAGDARPMTSPTERADVVRPDEPRESLPRERLLAGAPEPCDGFYAVPKTVEKDA